MNTTVMGVALAATLLAASLPTFAGDDRGHGRWKDDHSRNHDHRRGHDRGHSRGHTHVVYAEVIHVEPIFEYGRDYAPPRDCYDAPTVYRERHGSGAGMLLGGVIGGVIGQDIARGHDNDGAVIVGTLIGAMIGHDLDRDRVVVSAPGRSCEARRDRYPDRHIVGYRVKYRYDDRFYFTRTDRHPGPRIRVTITLGN